MSSKRFGVGNFDIARILWNNPRRGINRGSFVTRASVHNQRVSECLWSEMIRCVVKHFREMFFFFLKTRDLSIHLMRLVCSYVRINKALDELSNYWKYHPLSSAGKRSSLHLWHCGMAWLYYDPAFSELSGMLYLREYGIEKEALLPEINTPNNVEIPESRLTLCKLHLQKLTAVMVTKEKRHTSVRGNWTCHRKSLL